MVKEQIKDIPLLGYNITLNDDPEYSGVGLTIFVAGCPHKCTNCSNPESWNPSNGTMTSMVQIEEKIKESLKLIRYVCFCGGEFLLYKEQLMYLSKYVKQYNLKTILYTGYLFEEIDKSIITHCDIIVDGKYDCEKQQIGFPASSNQRVFSNGIQLTNLNKN